MRLTDMNKIPYKQGSFRAYCQLCGLENISDYFESDVYGRKVCPSHLFEENPFSDPKYDIIEDKPLDPIKYQPDRLDDWTYLDPTNPTEGIE